MKLHLLRHGVAVERGAAGYEDDAARPLTPEGLRKTKRIAMSMQKLDVSFDLILSSRVTRARQTAEVVAKIFKATKRLKFTAHLAPDGDPEALIHDLRKVHHRLQSVLLVGHEPYLSSLISTLLSGKTSFKVTLKKGGLCLLTAGALRHGPCATLEWLLTPRQMMKVR